MIEVLICTIDERIKNVIHNISTQLQDVCYLVSWQQTSSSQQDPPHELLDRSDVRIVSIQGRGISANRNNALKHAKGDILVISDDDCRYTAENFKTIISTYSKYPDADIIAFQAIDENGQPYKANYPEKTYLYKERPYGSYISSCEITLRRKEGLPLFDTRFGLGSKTLKCGEEEIFLHDAFTLGFNIIYIPKVIVSTPRNTTGNQFTISSKVRMSKGAVLKYIYGYWGAILRSIKFSLVHTHFHPRNFWRIFRDMYRGIQYIK
jgi:glycosyltransferase involved in cell wall biosynthesis